MMREEFVSDLTEGMVTARDIYSSDGIMIVPRGIILTDPIIRHLEALGVFTVKVEDDLKQPEPAPFIHTEDYVEFKQQYSDVKDKVNNAFEAVLRKDADAEEINQIVNDSWQICSNSKNSYDTINMLYSMHSYSDATYTHCMNVGIIAALIGKWLGWSEEKQRLLHMCGLFHDIGKLQIPKEVLDKPSKLTDEEYDIMKQHTLKGYELIKNMGLAPSVVNAALMHHERCDGSGYPNGLTGDKIDKLAKVVAIADVYEAMTANRVYRSAMCPFDVVARFEETGFQEFETEYLLVFLQNIVDSYLHSRVLLSNGEKAEIILINRQKGSRPLVMTSSGKPIDLNTEKDIRITHIYGYDEIDEM